MTRLSHPHTFNATQFRRQLHMFPELSNQEVNTAAKIVKQLSMFGLTAKENIGGNGIVCVIDSGNTGETTLFRADFDALPIVEKSTHQHVSQHCGVMHACGHDGHTASLLMVAEHLANHPPSRGKIILLFQPAEETGTGAEEMLKHPWLNEQSVDNTFAYHNLPGHPVGSILVKPDTFACASTGVSIEFQGKTSHAARPENGISPVEVMMTVIRQLQTLSEHYPDTFTLVTIVHAQLGEEAFGVSPGYAKVMATLRSECNTTFEQMKKKLLNTLSELENNSDIKITLQWDEPFNAAVNSAKHCDIVAEQAEELGLSVIQLSEPMRWSEDFSQFLLKWPGALFCIGSGESHPQLHNPDYDFPDEILATASSLFISIAQRLHK